MSFQKRHRKRGKWRCVRQQMYSHLVACLSKWLRGKICFGKNLRGEKPGLQWQVCQDIISNIYIIISIIMPRQLDMKRWARLSFESFIRDNKLIHIWVTHSISLNQGCRKVEQFQKLNKLATTIETTPTQRQTNKLSFRPPLFLPPGVDPLHFSLIITVRWSRNWTGLR